ncbi:MAG: flavin monoamine oxidase family protein, partial [Methyloceanibacter sp.]
MTQNPDIVVIGAGAAGVGAGLALARAGASFIVLEARDRIGGRAYSDTSSLGHLWDHGCHWLHSADKNVLRQVADKIGHRYRSRYSPSMLETFLDGRWEATTMREDFVWRLLGEVADAGKQGKDIAASALLDRSHPWYPMIHHWLTLMYSAEPDDISTFDAGRYDDTHLNYPVEDGYGALIARIAVPLPIRTGVAALKVRAQGQGIAVETSQGTVEARAAIIAVPARMIETGRLVIEPGLPPHIAQAFDDVPMGWYEKIALLLDESAFGAKPAPYVDIFDPVAPDTHPLNFEIKPFGRPIAITHIAGTFAREMSEAGEAAMIDFALSALVRAYGADLRKHFKKGAVTHWSSDKFTNGAYSCAKPGRGLSRAAFAEPIHDRIFLAGEHVHPTFMATAHGAYETGIWAASKA